MTRDSKVVEGIAAGTDCTAVSADAEVASYDMKYQFGRNMSVDYTQYTKDGDWGKNENMRGFVHNTTSGKSDSTTDTGFTDANCYIQCKNISQTWISYTD
jgi:hypothetical protein